MRGKSLPLYTALTVTSSAGMFSVVLSISMSSISGSPDLITHFSNSSFGLGLSATISTFVAASYFPSPSPFLTLRSNFSGFLNLASTITSSAGMVKSVNINRVSSIFGFPDIISHLSNTLPSLEASASIKVIASDAKVPLP